MEPEQQPVQETTQEDEGLLDFETAMRDFATMFPTVSRERIEEVLREHEGDVASTIDHLLSEIEPRTPASPTTPSAAQSETTSGEKKKHHHHHHHHHHRHHHSTTHTKSQSPPSSPNQPKPSEVPSSASISLRSRRSRLSLDEVEMEKSRIAKMKRENEKKLERVTDENEARVLEDEQLALLLMNRELARCMKKENAHPRATSYAGRIHSKRHSSHAVMEHGPRVPEGPVLDETVIEKTENNLHHDIRDTLKLVSKASKARLSQITARFRRQSEVC